MLHLLRKTPTKVGIAQLVALLLLLAGLVQTAGCLSRARNLIVDDDQTALATAAAQQKVELRFLGWHGTADAERALTALLATAPTAYPQLNLTATLAADYDAALQTALASESPPDLILVDSFHLPMLAAAGGLEPLPLLFDPATDVDAPLRSAFTYNGVPYCLPKEVQPLALVYDKSRFDLLDLAYPTTAWLWADLRTAAERLTNKQTGHYGLALPADFSRWLPFLYQAGGAVMREDLSTLGLDSPAAAEALTFYANLVLDEVAAPPAALDSQWAGEALGKGKAAMVIEGPWIVDYLQSNFPNVRYGVAPLPVGPMGQATVAFANCLAIPSNSQHKDEAVLVLRHFVGAGADAYQQWISTGKAIPALVTARAAWASQHQSLQPFLDTLPSARLWQFPGDFQPTIDTFNHALQKVFDGFILVDAVLGEVQASGSETVGQ